MKKQNRAWHSHALFSYRRRMKPAGEMEKKKMKKRKKTSDGTSFFGGATQI